MAIKGMKLSELTDKVEDIQGTERIYVSDGSGVPKYIETNQLASANQIPDTSGFITETNADGKYATKESVGNKADKIEFISVDGATPTQEIQPNKLYKFGECTSLTVTLASEIAGIYNEYMFEFVSGATPTILNLPETVKWMETPTIDANKTYQVSIVNNLAVIGGWANE